MDIYEIFDVYHWTWAIDANRFCKHRSRYLSNIKKASNSGKQVVSHIITKVI